VRCVVFFLEHDFTCLCIKKKEAESTANTERDTKPRREWLAPQNTTTQQQNNITTDNKKREIRPSTTSLTTQPAKHVATTLRILLGRCSRGGGNPPRETTKAVVEAHAVKRPRGGITRSAATARGGPKRDVGDRGRPSNDDGEQLRQHQHLRGPKRNPRGNIHEGASHARQQLPEPSTTSVAEDGQATTTANNYGNSSLSEGRAWHSGRGGCINVAFRKEMTPADANHIETTTQRNFRSEACPNSRRRREH
jgi:hypothetical protein